MKKVIVAIYSAIHVENNASGAILQHSANEFYIGSVWAHAIKFFTNEEFVLLDENGNWIFTGGVRDLHARIGDERTFGGEYVEFKYTANNHYFAY